MKAKNGGFTRLILYRHGPDLHSQDRVLWEDDSDMESVVGRDLTSGSLQVSWLSYRQYEEAEEQ